MTTSRYARRQKVIALVAVFLLVVGLGGAAIAIAASGSGDDGPDVDTSPTLTLSRTSTGLAEGALATSGNAGGTSKYVLKTTLPTTTQEGAVITPANSTTTEEQVTALLAALGMKGVTPTSVEGGWTAKGTVDGMPAAFALDEKAGNLWQYGRGPAAACLSVNPGAAPDVASSCAATSGQSRTVAGPGRAALLREAKKLFALVGITPGAGLRANDDKQGSTVLDVPLTVEGLPVVGLAVSVGVDKYGIESALGVLDPTYSVVGEYPLISAQTAYEQLATGPIPEPAACPDTAQCALPSTYAVTGARLAWLTSQESGRTVLVPAWQFEIGGFYGPAVVAVDPAYLAASSPAATPVDTGAASSEPGSPGQIEPAPPSTVSPPRDR